MRYRGDKTGRGQIKQRINSREHRNEMRRLKKEVNRSLLKTAQGKLGLRITFVHWVPQSSTF